MYTTVFPTFDSAKCFSAWASLQFKQEITLKSVGPQYGVVLPRPLELDQACHYICYRCNSLLRSELGPGIVAVLNVEARQR